MRVVFIVLILISSLFAEQFLPKDHKKLDQKYVNVFNIKYPKLKQKFPKYTKVPLVKASSELFFMKDTISNFFKMRIIFPIGSINDNKDRRGEIYYTLSNMVKGGTESFSKQQLDSILDFYSMSIDYSVGTEFSSISLTCLRENLDLGVKILYEILNKPKFNDDYLQLQKSYTIDYYKREIQEPNNFISRKYKELIYGDNAYSQPAFGDTNSIKKIDIEVLKKNHKRFENIGSLKIGVLANISIVKATKIAWDVVGKYNKRKFFIDKNSLIFIKKNKIKPQIVFYNKKDLNQVFLRFGTKGISLYSKDYFNNIVAMNILGSGGFNSRIVDEIRVKRGLSYSPGFTHRTNTYVDGDYVGYVQTRTEKIGEVLNTVYAVVDDYVHNGVSTSELNDAKTAIINSLPFLYDSKYSFLNTVLDYSSKNRDIKNLYNLASIYEHIKLKDVNGCVKRNMTSPNKFCYVMVGNWEKSKDMVIKFAKKHKLKYKIINLEE